MKTIIGATDFSAAAMNAASYAWDMAKAIGADLHFLHSFQLPVSYSDVAIMMSVDEMQHIAEADLKNFITELKQKKGAEVPVTGEVRMGAFFQELETLCEEYRPYAVILGSQGTTAAERFFFGSHAVKAMKNLNWPLITVPPGASFHAIKRIGLACDFNKVVDTMPVEEIRQLLTDFNAELHILNTAPKENFDPEVVFESGMLQEMLEGVTPHYHFITHENTDTGILEFAEQNGIDLLLVLPRRHSLFDSLVHKSHTREFVLHSHVPVMALHNEHA